MGGRCSGPSAPVLYCVTQSGSVGLTSPPAVPTSLASCCHSITSCVDDGTDAPAAGAVTTGDIVSDTVAVGSWSRKVRQPSSVAQPVVSSGSRPPVGVVQPASAASDHNSSVFIMSS